MQLQEGLIGLNESVVQVQSECRHGEGSAGLKADRLYPASVRVQKKKKKEKKPQHVFPCSDTSN